MKQDSRTQCSWSVTTRNRLPIVTTDRAKNGIKVGVDFSLLWRPEVYIHRQLFELYNRKLLTMLAPIAAANAAVYRNRLGILNPLKEMQ